MCFGAILSKFVCKKEPNQNSQSGAKEFLEHSHIPREVIQIFP